jgi:hypothetical protein
LGKSIKYDLQFHGQPFYEVVQGCLFNQITPYMLQFFQGLMPLHGLQEILVKDFETTTYSVLQQLAMQWGQGK